MIAGVSQGEELVNVGLTTMRCSLLLGCMLSSKPMQPDPSLETGMFSIIAVGAMTPQIHHPLWYKINKFLPDDEVDAAMALDVTISAAQARFTTGKLTITCLADRWQVETTDPLERGSILSLVKRIFDARLKDTPVRQIGFTNAISRKTPGLDARKLMAQAMTAAFGLPALELATATAILVTTPPPAVVSLSSGATPEDLVIAINTNYLVGSQEADNYYFDIAPFLDEHFEPDFARARTIADTVISTLNRRD